MTRGIRIFISYATMAEMKERPWSRKSDRIQLILKVFPGSPKNEIKEIRDGVLLLRIQGIPEKGKANKALVKFLSKELGLKQDSIGIVQGDTGRNKRIALPVEAGPALETWLAPWLEERE